MENQVVDKNWKNLWSIRFDNPLNDAESLKLNKKGKIYGKINSGKIFVAKNIKTAEAAKVIENTQRDINVAFINEITKLFKKIDINIFDVLNLSLLNSLCAIDSSFSLTLLGPPNDEKLQPESVK